jgi:hypothetical protein
MALERQPRASPGHPTCAAPKRRLNRGFGCYEAVPDARYVQRFSTTSCTLVRSSAPDAFTSNAEIAIGSWHLVREGLHTWARCRPIRFCL